MIRLLKIIFEMYPVTLVSLDRQGNVVIEHETLEERLKNKEYISCDFKTKKRGWCRAIWDPYGVDEHGNIIEALFIIQSIDEEKLLEIEQQEKLKQSMLEAQKANKAKSEFISSMSHDMRTPMNGISLARKLISIISETCPMATSQKSKRPPFQTTTYW